MQRCNDSLTNKQMTSHQLNMRFLHKYTNLQPCEYGSKRSLRMTKRLVVVKGGFTTTKPMLR